jgi:hypothetical protein
MRRVVASAAFLFLLGIAGGFQFQGNISDFDLDMDSGFTLGLELMFEIPIVKLGVGYEYGFPRDTNGVLSNIEYNLFYGIARVHFLGPAYAMARAGYADLSAELPDLKGSDDGLSWGLGLGVKISRFKIEVAYNDFDITVNDFGGSVDYSNYAARLIFSF